MKNKRPIWNVLKALCLLWVSCCLLSCDPIYKFEKMDTPIIVVGKDTSGCITLIDCNNEYVTIPNTYYLARTLTNTYSIGDTLLYFK